MTHDVCAILAEGVRDMGDNVIVGGEDRFVFVGVPLGGGRARIYLAPPRPGPRFAGPGASRALLEATRMRCLPDAGRWADAEPVGRCATYGGEDTWVDTPAVPGAVLVGDAGGYNSPIIGQGLALAVCDARVLAELLLGSDDWTPGGLEPYSRARTERLRRVRFAAQLWALLWQLPPAQRARIVDDPLRMRLIVGAFTGYDHEPAELFADATARHLMRVAEAA